MNEAAIRMLEAADLPVFTKTDLFEMYMEDLEEHSESTALDKLEQGIKDSKED